MVLLQAAMLAGYIILIFLGIYLLIFTPILIGLLMKAFWNFTDKKQNIIDKKPYYKDPFPFIISIFLSVSILIYIFYWLIIWLDKLYPVVYL